MRLEEAGDRLDQRAREEHPRLRRIDADVREHGLELGDDELGRQLVDRRDADGALGGRARRSRTCRSRPPRRTPSGRPGCPRRRRCRSRNRQCPWNAHKLPPFAGMTRIRFDGCDLSPDLGHPGSCEYQPVPTASQTTCPTVCRRDVCAGASACRRWPERRSASVKRHAPGLRELEQLTGEGPQELGARAVEAYRREVIMTQTNEVYAQLRAEGSDFFDELRQWEVTLMDGLEAEDFSGVGPDDIGLTSPADAFAETQRKALSAQTRNARDLPRPSRGGMASGDEPGRGARARRDETGPRDLQRQTQSRAVAAHGRRAIDARASGRCRSGFP